MPHIKYRSLDVLYVSLLRATVIAFWNMTYHCAVENEDQCEPIKHQGKVPVHIARTLKGKHAYSADEYDDTHAAACDAIEN